MKISKLIHQLQQMQILHGDIEVGHEIGEFQDFEYVERLVPCYPKDKNYVEDKTKAAWCIEIR
jgi:hypothetical protein